MVATNLLTYKQHQVSKYKNVLYIEYGNGYYILEPIAEAYDELDPHFLYSHYAIDNDYTTIYSAFWSNDYKWLAKTVEQLRLDLGGNG